MHRLPQADGCFLFLYSQIISVSSYSDFLGGSARFLSAVAVFLILGATLSFAANYTLSIKAVPGYAGTVAGAGTYQYGQAVPLKADANPGWQLLNWKSTVGSCPITLYSDKSAAVKILPFSGTICGVEAAFARSNSSNQTNATQTTKKKTPPAPPSYGIELKQCGQKITAQGYYYLAHDLLENESKPCLQVDLPRESDYAVIDCRGYAIRGTTVNFGQGVVHGCGSAASTGKVQVKNCRFEKMFEPVKICRGRDSLVGNNTINGTYYGVTIGSRPDYPAVFGATIIGNYINTLSNGVVLYSKSYSTSLKNNYVCRERTARFGKYSIFCEKAATLDAGSYSTFRETNCAPLKQYECGKEGAGIGADANLTDLETEYLASLNVVQAGGGGTGTTGGTGGSGSGGGGGNGGGGGGQKNGNPPCLACVVTADDGGTGDGGGGGEKKDTDGDTGGDNTNADVPDPVNSFIDNGDTYAKIMNVLGVYMENYKEK